MAQDRRVSVDLVAMAVASDPVLVSGGAGVTLPGPGFLRLRATAVAGRRGSETAGRGEVLVELVLDPASQGWAPFGGAGVAADGGGGTLDGRLVVVVGLEQRPGRGRGWRLEAGLGGGARAAVGYRLPL